MGKMLKGVRISIILSCMLILNVLCLCWTAPTHAEWTAVGPFGGEITALAVDPAAPATIYAGTISDGVYMSTNAGASWTAVSSGLPAAPNTAITALAIDPAVPSTLYAGTGWCVYKTTN